MRIYFDHNATTPPHPEALRAMAEASAAAWANPSSVHEEGRAAREVVERARREVAALIGAPAHQIVFTSGGTEGNNTALRQAVRRGRAGQVVSSPIEHPSVLATLQALQGEGVPVRFLPVDRQGRIDPDDLKRALLERPTALVSLALVNHEIGNLYPIPAFARLAYEHGALFHCDAVQAVGRVPVRVEELEVDLLTVSAHKLHGPKGVGALYVRDQLSPLLLGGQQERGRRAGTENVPAIAGFGAACRLAAQDLGGRADRIRALRERLLARLLAIPGAELHGDPGHRAPGTANVGFAGVEGELLMMNLDLCGVAVSTGAACSSGSVEPSPVLRALGYTREEAARAVRFSLGSGNTAEEVDQVAGLVEESVTRIRSLG